MQECDIYNKITTVSISKKKLKKKQNKETLAFNFHVFADYDILVGTPFQYWNLK